MRSACPKLAVWKFASCDGCQLTLLNCEDELLSIVDRIEIAYFPEATRAVVKGPYDLSLVEGSITTRRDAERIVEIRRASRRLVSIGACATAGGIQALRNVSAFGAFRSVVYPTPEILDSLARSSPISEAVRVDFELPGCPIDRGQLLELISAFLSGRSPRLPNESVCIECKRRGNVCLLVAGEASCLGPITRTGCGALCPAYQRPCYGCFGPTEAINTPSLVETWKRLGAAEGEIERALRGLNAGEALRGVNPEE